jgi:hypothetical protein
MGTASGIYNSIGKIFLLICDKVLKFFSSRTNATGTTGPERIRIATLALDYYLRTSLLFMACMHAACYHIRLLESLISI